MRRRAEVLDLRQLGVGDDRPLEPQQSALAGRLLQQIALRPDRGDHRGDNLLADRIERRIRDLGEELLEIVVEQLRPIREHGQRRVVAHRADRLLPVDGHRGHDDPQIFERVAERALELQQWLLALAICLGLRSIVEIVELELVFVEPFPIGLPRGQAALDLLVGDDPTLGRIDQEHPARPQSPLIFDSLGRHIDDASLRGHHDIAPLRNPIAAGAQAVAIEAGADQRAIGEGHRGRAVPRLEQAGLIFIVGLQFVGHAFVPCPRLGDQHRHRLRQCSPGEHEQLEHVVENGRVARIGRADREDLFQIGSVLLARQDSLAGVHPVNVAAERVDLAVVGEVAERMGEVPGGKGVGAIPLVHQGERRQIALVAQIDIEALGLLGLHQALVDHHARGKTRNVEPLQFTQVARANFVLDPPSNHVQLPFEHVGGRVCAAGNEELPNRRLNALGQPTERAGVDGHIAPTEKLLPLLSDDGFQPLLAEFPLRGIGGKKHSPRAVLTPRR